MRTLKITFKRALSSSRKVVAYGFSSDKSPVEKLAIERREVGARDVGVEILYCGLCHTDLKWIRNDFRRLGLPIRNGNRLFYALKEDDFFSATMYPFVPGHEIVGKVSRKGPLVSRLGLGDFVAIGALIGCCRNCPACRSNHPQFCKSSVFTVNHLEDAGNRRTFGGFSEYIVVDDRFVNTIPRGFSQLSRVPPLLCAGVSCYNPLKRFGVGFGSRVGVYGIGGIGHFAVKLASAMGAEVTVLSRSKSKLDEARRLGAIDLLITTSPASMGRKRAYFDLVIDCVSGFHPIDPILELLTTDGTGKLVLLGIPPKPLSFGAHNLVLEGREIYGSFLGSVADIQELIEFCFRNNVLPEVQLITVDRLSEAIEDLGGENVGVKYRYVLDIKKSGQ